MSLLHRAFRDEPFSTTEVTQYGRSAANVASQGYLFQPGIANPAQALSDTGIDYLHTTEHRALAAASGDDGPTLAKLAKRYGGLSIIANGQLDGPADAAEVIDSGDADVAALAKPALAKRDWPRRVRAARSLSPDLPAGLLAPTRPSRTANLPRPGIDDHPMKGCLYRHD